MDDTGFTKSSSSSMKPISLVGRHCYPFFRDHLHNPYPTSQEKEAIVAKANSPDVTLVSVSNWFANSRRRSGWIELCNEYYNGDTKLMVEICSHILINGGESRSSDPPTLVDRILKMERKVQSWHEGETEPSSWAVALCDLIRKYETCLRIEAENKSSDIVVPVDPAPTLMDHNDDQETHSVIGVKRSHKDYMLGSYASDILPRSLSVSSVSSISSSSSECYSSEEEERPVKRGRINTKPTKYKKYLPEDLDGNQHKPHPRTDSLQLKRRLSISSFDENAADSARGCKRFRLTDIASPEGSDELLIEVDQSREESIHVSPHPISQSIIHSTELDISAIPTVDLQPPDASWSLDINLYDWSSSPDILSMMDPNIQPGSHEESSPESRTNATEPKMDDADQWLRSFFLGDLSETAQTFSHESAPITFTLDDTAQVASDSKIQQRTGNQLELESDIGHTHESSLTLHGVGSISWPLSSDPNLAPFPAEFLESFLPDFPYPSPSLITDIL